LFHQQGNVIQRTNSSGSVVSESDYDAFGAGESPDPSGYNGRLGHFDLSNPLT
jgi:hypothetical protein